MKFHMPVGIRVRVRSTEDKAEHYMSTQEILTDVYQESTVPFPSKSLKMIMNHETLEQLQIKKSISKENAFPDLTFNNMRFDG